MNSPLKTLNRVKKFELDEQQKLLSAELERESAYVSALKSLIELYEQEKIFASAHPELCNFGLYTEQYLKKRRRLEKQLESVRAKIEEIRNVMTDIFKEKKTYEIVDNNMEINLRKNEEAQEQKLLDEIGSNAYIKNAKNKK